MSAYGIQSIAVNEHGVPVVEGDVGVECVKGLITCKVVDADGRRIVVADRLVGDYYVQLLVVADLSGMRLIEMIVRLEGYCNSSVGKSCDPGGRRGISVSVSLCDSTGLSPVNSVIGEAYIYYHGEIISAVASPVTQLCSFYSHSVATVAKTGDGLHSCALLYDSRGISVLLVKLGVSRIYGNTATPCARALVKLVHDDVLLYSGSRIRIRAIRLFVCRARVELYLA